jgi:hypothetical protein
VSDDSKNYNAKHQGQSDAPPKGDINETNFIKRCWRDFARAGFRVWEFFRLTIDSIGATMCNCFDVVGNKFHEKLIEKVPEGAEVSKDFDTGWCNTLFSVETGRLLVMLKYRITYRGKKKNGEPAKSLNKLEANINMTYCPFCGKKQN